MKKFMMLLLVLIPLICAGRTFAADGSDDDSKWPVHRLGFGGSMMSGYGLFYQNQNMGDYSAKVSIFGYGQSNQTYNNQLTADIGFELQRNLKRTKETRFYLLAGTYYDYYENQNGYYPTPSQNQNDYNIERGINIGAGFGFEVIVWNHLSINMDCGYYGKFGINDVYESVYDVNGKNTYKRVHSNPKTFGFGVGGGVSYAL